MIFKKKKQIKIGDFVTDNINDFGIAKYYEKKYKKLLESDFDKTKKITNLEGEIEYLKNELYKYEIINNKLRNKLVELRVDNGINVITGEYIR